MSNMLRLLMSLVLVFIALNCGDNKKNNIYNTIDFGSIDPRILDLGKKVYDNICASCHNYGSAGAATMIDFRAWDKSAKKGIVKVLENVSEGYKGALGVMPPKGNCLSCSDEEIRASVLYLFKKVLDNKEKID